MNPTQPIDIQPIDGTALERIVAGALAEDAPWGDITSSTLIPADATATAELAAREPGVFSGGPVLAEVVPPGGPVRAGGPEGRRTAPPSTPETCWRCCPETPGPSCWANAWR